MGLYYAKITNKHVYVEVETYRYHIRRFFRHCALKSVNFANHEGHRA